MILATEISKRQKLESALDSATATKKRMEGQLVEALQQKEKLQDCSQAMLKKLLAAALLEKGYIYQHNVGRGAFGLTYSCTKGRKRYALKVQYNEAGDVTLKKENAVMKALHANPAAGTQYLLKPDEGLESINGLVVILTPFYGRTLKHYMDHKWKGAEAPIKRLAKGLCLGLALMHECGYAHRDIKPDNVLLQNEEGDPVIIDFGLVNAEGLRTGTVKYLAPEQKGGAGPVRSSEWWCLQGWDQRKFDSWAVGLIVQMCFEGHVVPPQAGRFIKDLMQLDHKKRLSVAEAVEHEWFTEQQPLDATERLFK